MIKVNGLDSFFYFNTIKMFNYFIKYYYIDSTLKIKLSKDRTNKLNMKIIIKNVIAQHYSI